MRTATNRAPRSTLRALIWTGFGVAWLGCGGSAVGGSAPPGSGQATVTSSIPTVAPRYSGSAFAWVFHGKGAGVQVNIAVYNLSGVADICGLVVNSGVTPASSHLVTLLVGDAMQPLVPGRYSVGEMANVFNAEYYEEDDHCTPSPATSATSGTIELTRADSSFEGTFDVTFPTGRMVGSFNAPACDDPTRYAGMTDAGAACVSYPACDAGGSGVRPCAS
jgi:hypothetical protein